jgi:hypothetical protein
MGGGRTTFKSVTRGAPCEICGGADKCSRSADGLLVCGRPPDAPPAGYVYLGRAKNDDQFGLYRREDDPVLRERDRQWQEEHRKTPFRGRAVGGSPPPNGTHQGNGTAPPPDLAALARRLAGDLDGPRLEQLAMALSLPAAIVATVPHLGYSPTGFHEGYRDQPCWTFPEVDAAGRVCGLLCRYPDGKKKAMPGGSRGLTVLPGWEDQEGPLLVPEGPSDPLGLAAAGLAAVGRPDNTGGVAQLAELLRAAPDRPVIVLGEYDPKPDGKWPGRDGAVQTAEALAALLGRPVWWALPPGGAKDTRQWVLGRHPDPTCLDAWHGG